MTVKYPHITVELVGTVGNAISILAKVRRALVNNNVSQEEIDLFTQDATSDDYNHLLYICMQTVHVY